MIMISVKDARFAFPYKAAVNLYRACNSDNCKYVHYNM